MHSFSQDGFSKHYNFGTQANFNNILLDEDEIVVTGAVVNEVSQLLNILIAKFDTIGNIIAYNTYEDPESDLVMSVVNYPLVSTSDGGYLMAGDMLNKASSYIAKWNSDLELVHFWEYPFLDNAVSFPTKLLEVQNGYLFISTKQVSNLRHDVFVTKLDLNGNILWEYAYGNPNEDEFVSAVLKTNENEIVLGAVKPGGVFVGLPQYDCPRSWIFAIDSLGVKQWEWTGEDCDGGLVLRILKTEDDGWLYTTKQLEAFIDAPLIGDIAAAPYVVKRDANFNKLWERRIANNYLGNGLGLFLDLKQTNDGHYLMLGDVGLPEPIDPDNNPQARRYTCLYKVTTDGDSLFRQSESIQLEQGNNTNDHRSGGFVELPSGSIIVAARFVEQDVATYGWLYKVDKNGCMFPDDCITTDVEVVHIESNAIKISPNPTSDIVYVESDVVPDEIILLDMSGHVLSSVTHRSEMDIRDFPVGVYLLKVRVGEEVYLEKVLRN